MSTTTTQVPCPSCGELSSWIFTLTEVGTDEFRCDCGYYYYTSGGMPPEQIWPTDERPIGDEWTPIERWQDYLLENGFAPVGEIIKLGPSGKSDEELRDDLEKIFAKGMEEEQEVPTGYLDEQPSISA